MDRNLFPVRKKYMPTPSSNLTIIRPANLKKLYTNRKNYSQNNFENNYNYYANYMHQNVMQRQERIKILLYTAFSFNTSLHDLYWQNVHVSPYGWMVWIVKMVSTDKHIYPELPTLGWNNLKIDLRWPLTLVCDIINSRTCRSAYVLHP